MKKLRAFFAATVLAGTMMIVSAPPASADCVGQPNVCELVCQVGLGNKYTQDYFKFCYVW